MARPRRAFFRYRRVVIDGFRFAGVASGIKATGKRDLGLIVCDRPASAAAVFTRNRMAAAPVGVSRALLESAGGLASGVVVNSGNANAATGPRGVKDARAMVKQAARSAPRGGAMLVASTGVIGVPLPMDRVERGIADAAGGLAADRFTDFADAILTTDRARKIAERTAVTRAGGFRLIGCTKGAGMIAPDMATTLSFVATDAEVGPGPLARALRAACAETYNAITVDGDTSTNDMICVLASGASRVRPSPAALTEALRDLLDDLARQLMHGGEGVHHVVTVRVIGAARAADAVKVARRIANSPLVKTAIAGADPNWGRIVCAAGNAGVDFDPARLALRIGDVPVVRRGAPIAGAWHPAARAVMGRPDYEIVLDLGDGDASGRYLACDLSHDYVSINADYTS
jgi:glutamate N-acetyltransferase/amino-acid N-acetyltransferase